MAPATHFAAPSRADAPASSARGPFRRLLRAAAVYALAGAILITPALAMFVRELDGFFDVVLGHGSWAAVDTAVFAAAVFALGRGWRETVSDFADFAESPLGLMAFSAVFAAVAFSQLLGWKGLWRQAFEVGVWDEVKRNIVGYDQNVERHVKNVVEEALELFSYASLLAAAAVPRLLAPRTPSGAADGPGGDASAANEA